MSFPFRTVLAAENTVFGTLQAVWKERFWGKSVFEGNIRTVVFTTDGSQRQLGVGVHTNLPNDKRMEQFCDYLLENDIDADCTFPPPVWFECSTSSLRTIDACESFHAHFNALFYSAHPHILFLYLNCKKYRMRPTSNWEALLHKGLKNQL